MTLLLLLLSVAPALAGTPVEDLRARAQEDAPAALAGCVALVDSLSAHPPTVQLADALDLLVALRARVEGTPGRIQSRPEAERAVEIRESLPDGEPLALATSIRELGVIDWVEGKASAARAKWERALEIRERELGPEHEDTAQVLYNLASAAKAQGDFEAAEDYNQRCEVAYVAAFGADHPRVGFALNQRANLYFDLGRLEEALALYEQTLVLVEPRTGKQHPFYAGVQGNIGSTLEALGRYDEALERAERALAVAEEVHGAVHEDVSDHLNQLAAIHLSRAEPGRAHELYQRSLAINRELFGEDHYRVGQAYNNLALTTEALGDDAGALVLFERALAIKERWAEDRAWDLALALNNLANEHIELGQPDRARSMLERALAMREEVYGPDHWMVARTLENLHLVELLDGDVAAAREDLERAVRLYEQNFGPDHPKTAAVDWSLAALELQEGRLDQAATHLERCMATRRAALGDNHPELARDLVLRSMLRAEQGRPADAIADALAAEDLGAEHLRLSIQGFSERNALGYAGVRPRGLGLALASAAEGGSEEDLVRIWDTLVRNRSLVLDEMVRRRALARAAVADHFDLYERLRQTSTRLANLVIRGADDDDTDTYSLRLLQARQAKEDVERELAQRSALFRDQLQARSAGFAEVAARLRDGDVLVSFVRYQPEVLALEEPDDRYALLVLASGQAPRLVGLGRARRLDALVSMWRSEMEQGPFLPGRSVADADAAAERAGRALAGAILDPWADELRDARRVFVVPDGSLHRVNLAALPFRGRYLVEHDVLVHTLQTERDLLTEAGPSRGRGLLALGGAQYDASPAAAGVPVATPDAPSPGLFRGAVASCPQFQALRFDALPAAREEVASVLDTWEGDRTTSLQGPEATEAAFKAEAPGHRVLHLATHAFFLGEACGPERAAADLGRRQVASISVAGDTPLLLSGLAFAGANRRAEGAGTEDGILTAEEVATLDLSSVEWAVLSACDTGSGVVRDSEGIMGLPRAFRVAGARTVILSLWRVEDRATRDWMEALYRGHLSRDLPAAAAVRFAARSILERRRADGAGSHPFYWAAFLALGS